jgi:hypothetical protein
LAVLSHAFLQRKGKNPVPGGTEVYVMRGTEFNLEDVKHKIKITLKFRYFVKTAQNQRPGREWTLLHLKQARQNA